MQKHQIQVAQEDIERVDTLRYMWAKLQEQVGVLQTSLLEIQPKFHQTLITNVELYQREVESYTTDYKAVSALLVGLLGMCSSMCSRWDYWACAVGGFHES